MSSFDDREIETNKVLSFSFLDGRQSEILLANIKKREHGKSLNFRGFVSANFVLFLFLCMLKDLKPETEQTQKLLLRINVLNTRNKKIYNIIK